MNIACSIRAARRFQPSHRAVFSGCSWPGNATKRPTWPRAEPDGNPSAPCHATYASAYGERLRSSSYREMVLVRHHQAHRSRLRRICFALPINSNQESNRIRDRIAFCKCERRSHPSFRRRSRTRPLPSFPPILDSARSDRMLRVKGANLNPWR